MSCGPRNEDLRWTGWGGEDLLTGRTGGDLLPLHGGRLARWGSVASSCGMCGDVGRCGEESGDVAEKNAWMWQVA